MKQAHRIWVLPRAPKVGGLGMQLASVITFNVEKKKRQKVFFEMGQSELERVPV
jgi:hypothetical protein